jgi:hypothetical protein
MARPVSEAFNKFLLGAGFDRAVVSGGLRVALRLGRLWAASELDADPEALIARYPALLHGPFMRDAVRAALSRAMAHAAARRTAHAGAETAWQDAFFGKDGAALEAIEKQRRRAAIRYSSARTAFTLVPGWSRVPALQFGIPSVADVEAAHAARLASSDPFPVPGGALTASRRFRHRDRTLFWLRDDAAMPAWAKVIEPAAPVRATLISLHGLGIETEFLPDWPDPWRPLLEAGIRLVYAEASSHGRRRQPGWTAGELPLATTPLGMLSHFATHVGEIGRLVAWARDQSDGPVGIAGTSLGALTAQVVASRTAAWPAHCRPDAAVLITTSNDMLQVVERSLIATDLGLTAALAASPWDDAALARWRPLLEPAPAPQLDPARILAITGTGDQVTPPDGAAALADAWRLPAANRLQRPRGHFGQAVAMLWDDEARAAIVRCLTGGPRL